ncbi:MAG: ABC transporter permease [Anaerolineaceae bacterium]|nr:ABC transporter permease [Anaerolineaceae bacterium]MCY4008357.1 ABC transporter permease [Anaerolineaceae bacterium]
MNHTPRSLGLRLVFLVLPLLVALFVSAVILLLLNQEPGEVLRQAWRGAFGNERRIASVLNYWIPLSFAAMGLVITFRAGLWNIGIEGQMIMGAVFATYIPLYVPLPPILTISLSLVLAATGGAIWAVLVGVLRNRFGVHEIFGGVALNAIAAGISLYLVRGPWALVGNNNQTPVFPRETWLPTISDRFGVSQLMLILLVIAVLSIIFLMDRSRWGLQLKATGRNRQSALLLGVSVRSVSLSAFILCGALAGIGGAHRVLHTYHYLLPNVAGGIGFLGLLVVMLSGFHAAIVPLVAYFMAALSAGSTRFQTLLRLDPSLIDVLQGILVLTYVLFSGIQDRFFPRIREGNEEMKKEITTNE